MDIPLELHSCKPCVSDVADAIREKLHLDGDAR